MTKRRRRDDSSASKVVLALPARVHRFAILGSPSLLEAEDDRSYNVLLESICAAVKPLNILEELFVADIVILQWEILELRRLRSVLVAATTYEALKKALESHVQYNMLQEDFEERLVEELQANMPEDTAEEVVRKLASECVADEGDAWDKTDQILKPADKSALGVFNSKE
jgi:hypothetical protein